MIRELEKNMMGRRVFDRVFPDPPEGFPFEIRLGWRDSMQRVYGDGDVLELARFDAGRARFDEALSMRFGSISFLFVPTLILGTHDAVEQVLCKRGLIRTSGSPSASPVRLSPRLHKEAACFDWEDHSPAHQMRALHLIQKGADEHFRGAWFRSWESYLCKVAGSMARRSMGSLRYEDIHAAFCEVFWDLTRTYQSGDAYSFKSRLRFALMNRVDELYRALPPVTVSENGHRIARAMEKKGEKAPAFKAPGVLFEENHAVSANGGFGDNALDAMEERERSLAVRRALRALAPQDARRLKRYLEKPEDEPPEDILNVLASLRAELAEWGA
jgi:hypothetical protein